MVLNALAGEAIPMGLSCLAEFGRFIEIGKRDIYQNSRIPLRPLRQQRFIPRRGDGRGFPRRRRIDPPDAGGDFRTWSKRARCDRCPSARFPASRIDAAFRLMAGGKHIGKVVVAFPTPFVPRRGELPAPGFEVKPDGCYLDYRRFRRLRQSAGSNGWLIAARVILC